MNLPKTVVVFDYDTQNSGRFNTMLEGHFSVFSVPFAALPNLKQQQVAAFFILFTGIDEKIRRKIADLNHAFTKVPVVLFSPKPSPEQVTLAIEQGAKAYFTFETDEKTILMRLNKFHFESIKPTWFQWLVKKIYPTQNIDSQVISAPTAVSNDLMPANTVIKKLLAEPSEAASINANKIRVNFFGNLEVAVGNKKINVRSGALLLAYLCHNHPKPIHKQRLIDRFWADSQGDSARNCLNSTIHALRRAFNEAAPNQPVIVFNNEHYAIHPDWTVETDVEEFQKMWDSAKEVGMKQGFSAAYPLYKALISLYKDDFLASFTNSDWALGVRDTLRERYLTVLQHVADHYSKSQEYAIAIEYYKEILEMEELLEETHRKLITCYLSVNMHDRAMRQYKKCVETLAKNRLKPSREMLALYERILSGNTE